jgi:hypothetical protein
MQTSVVAYGALIPFELDLAGTFILATMAYVAYRTSAHCALGRKDLVLKAVPSTGSSKTS